MHSRTFDMRFTIHSPYFRRIVTVGLALTLMLLITLSSSPYHESTDSHPKSAEMTEKGGSGSGPDRIVVFGSTSKPEYARCQPVHHVMFLKTHKCASTTVQNILLRYGYQNNLTFVIPPFSNNLGEFDKFEKFRLDLALPLPSQFSNEYQIFAHHARYNKETIPKMMPQDTIYISILREPSAMYQSIWKFFSLHLRFGASLEEFVANPRMYYFNQSNDRSLQFGRNPIMSDFGLEKEDFDKTAVQELITYIGKQFSLVMISDQMDESLVLLRKLLCWTWEDVVAFHLNRQDKGHPVSLPEKVAKNILAWNNADHMLYQHFLAEFEKKKLLYGKKNLLRDVKNLRTIKADWEGKCSEGHNAGNNATQINLDLVNEKCQFLCMDELEFTDRIRGKQWPNYGFQSRYRGRKNRHVFVKNYCDELFSS